MRNLGCLVLGILLLPIFLIIIGPLLVLAALRGRQSIGPIMLNSSQYGAAGRIGALMLGLGLWLLVWGGLVWVVVNGFVPGSTTVTVAPPTLAPPLIVEEPASDDSNNSTDAPNIVDTVPTATDILVPTHTPTVLVIIDPTSTAELDATLPITGADTLNTPSATATAAATGTAGLTDTIVLTETVVRTATTEPSAPTVLAQTPEPTVILMATPAEEGSQSIDSTDVQTVTISPADSQAVLRTVEDGNTLLREAISLANEENIANLEDVWQGRALEKAEGFAGDLYNRYAKPFEVEFEYLASPAIKRATPDEVTVVSQEIWTYAGRTDINQEAFEFTYVLSRENGEWIITYYSFLNLPTPTATSTPHS